MALIDSVHKPWFLIRIGRNPLHNKSSNEKWKSSWKIEIKIKKQNGNQGQKPVPKTAIELAIKKIIPIKSFNAGAE